jgi:hypothetical protein
MKNSNLILKSALTSALAMGLGGVGSSAFAAAWAT